MWPLVFLRFEPSDGLWKLSGTISFFKSGFELHFLNFFSSLSFPLFVKKRIDFGTFISKKISTRLLFHTIVRNEKSREDRELLDFVFNLSFKHWRMLIVSNWKTNILLRSVYARFFIKNDEEFYYLHDSFYSHTVIRRSVYPCLEMRFFGIHGK